jgi:aminotransferase
MTRDELLKIAALAQRHNLVVITDEIYAELTFEGEHASIASLPGMAERTVFLHGFSKAYAMTGFRIGYACAPVAILEAMMKVHQYTMLCASILSQEAAIEAIEHGGPDTTAMRDQYQLRRNYFVDALNRMGLKCHLPRGSFYAFPNITATGLASKDFAVRLLQEEKVACVPGSAFGPSGEGFLRCCFATSLEQLEIACDRMAKFVARLKPR